MCTCRFDLCKGVVGIVELKVHVCRFLNSFYVTCMHVHVYHVDQFLEFSIFHWPWHVKRGRSSDYKKPPMHVL